MPIKRLLGHSCLASITDSVGDAYARPFKKTRPMEVRQPKSFFVKEDILMQVEIGAEHRT
jgi:hypothetical protein